jgi:hypothetical protein
MNLISIGYPLHPKNQKAIIKEPNYNSIFLEENFKKMRIDRKNIPFQIVFIFVTFISCSFLQEKHPSNINTASLKNGWNGLKWGTGLEEARSKFPDCKSNSKELFFKSNDKWQSFCGFYVRPMYGFNKNEQFYLLILMPKMENRKHLDNSILRYFDCENDFTAGACFVDDLRIEVDDHFKIIRITNLLYDDIHNCKLSQSNR